MSKNRFLVIGGDAAGMSAASRAKRRKKDLETLVFEMGRHVSYAACGIPYYLEGLVEKFEQLEVMKADEFRTRRGIDVRLLHRVEKILPDRRRILVRDLETDRVREEAYDKLLISTGARPIVPPGIDPGLPGVFVIRGLEQAAALKEYLDQARPSEAVIIGGGYIGLEMAEALTERGLGVTMVEYQDRVMPSMEEEISELIARTLQERGVRLIIGAGARAIEPRGAKLELLLTDGPAVSADLVVLAIGVAPASELAREAGIELGVKGAIRVDRRQRTSAPGIWAAGDCAEAYHLLLQKNTYIPLALTANRQGRVAGSNVAGEPEEFPGIVGSAVTRVFDLTVARTGLGASEAAALGLKINKAVVEGRSRAHYYPGGAPVRTVVLADGGGRPWGVQMAGTDGVAQRINCWAVALSAGLDLRQIQDLDLAYAPPFSPVWDPMLVAADLALKKAG